MAAPAGGSRGRHRRAGIDLWPGLYSECLSAAGEAYTELSDPVQYRLIRAVVDDLALAHYAPLTS